MENSWRKLTKPFLVLLKWIPSSKEVVGRRGIELISQNWP
jgi:hypothetical protein